MLLSEESPWWSRCWPLDDKNELVDIDRKRRQFFLVPCALFPKWALSESNEKTLLTFCRRYLRVSLETMVFSPVEPPGWEMGKQGSVAKLVLKYSWFHGDFNLALKAACLFLSFFNFHRQARLLCARVRSSCVCVRRLLRRWWGLLATPRTPNFQPGKQAKSR